MKEYQKKSLLIIFLLILCSFSVLATSITDTNSTFTGNAVTSAGSYFDGLYDISSADSYITFNGTTIDTNETVLNNTIKNIRDLSRPVYYTSAYSSIQAALDAGGNGSHIIISNATTTITSPLTFYDRQRISCEGSRICTIQANASFAGDYLIGPKTPGVAHSNVMIEGITFDANNFSKYNIYFNNTAKSLIYDVMAADANDTNMFIDEDNFYTTIDFSRTVSGINGIFIGDNEVTVRDVRMNDWVGINITSYGNHINTANHIDLESIEYDTGTGSIGVLVGNATDIDIISARIEATIGTCLVMETTATDVLRVGGRWACTTDFTNNAAVSEFSRIEPDSLIIGRNIMFANSSFAFGNVTFDGVKLRVGPSTQEIGTTGYSFIIGNSSKALTAFGTATSAGLSTTGLDLELRPATGAVFIDTGSVNNSLDIRDSNTYDFVIKATSHPTLSNLNFTGETNNAILTLFNDTSAKFYGTITSSSSIWLNSTGSTSLNLNRADTSSNGGLVWYTGGAQRWTLGPKSSATSDDLYLRDNGHTTDALQIVYATTPIVNITGTLRTSGVFSLNNATNYNMDTFTLNASGGFNVSNKRVTTETKIICQQQTLGGTPGILGKTIVAGVGYTVQSSSTTDTSTTTCILIQPGG